jgi:hypothetical protein
MDGEGLYFCLMALGWLFLIGWTVVLVTACTIAFRQHPASGRGSASTLQQIVGRSG